MRQARYGLWVVLAVLACAAGAAEAPVGKPAPAATIAAATQGMAREAGFLDVYRDEAKGRVLLGLRSLDEPFLLLSSLPAAPGSNDVGLDRGQ